VGLPLLTSHALPAQRASPQMVMEHLSAQVSHINST